NPDSLNTILRKIANAFREAILEVVTAARASEKDTNLVYVELPGNVNFCRIEDEEYEPKEEEKVLEDKMKKRYRFILLRPEASVTNSVQNGRTIAAHCYIKIKNNLVVAILDSGTAVSIMSNRMMSKLQLKIIELSTIIVVTANRTQDQVVKIPMSYDRDHPFVKVDKDKGDRMFDEFKYENEVLDKAEGFYTKEISSNELDPEDESLEIKLKQNVCGFHLTPEQSTKVEAFLNEEKAIFVYDASNLG
ncbi:4409_t:CDS:2, partial [Cetraspora pellucida]